MEEVAGLDVAVQDIFLLAEGERAADIGSKADDLFLLQAAVSAPQIAVQRLQLFHTDQDGACGIVPQDRVIFDRDDIGHALELHHQVDFGAHAVDKFLNLTAADIAEEQVRGRRLHAG